MGSEGHVDEVNRTSICVHMVLGEGGGDLGMGLWPPSRGGLRRALTCQRSSGVGAMHAPLPAGGKGVGYALTMSGGPSSHQLSVPFSPMRRADARPMTYRWFSRKLHARYADGRQYSKSMFKTLWPSG